jgi:hypothetical protein
LYGIVIILLPSCNDIIDYVGYGYGVGPGGVGYGVSSSI